MADDQEMHPALQAFTEAFQTPEGQAWATDATQRVQDFLDHDRAVADARQAGENVALNLGAFRSRLVGMVQEAPHTAPLAFELVPGAVGALVHAIGPDEPYKHAEALINDIHNDIARTAVQTLALHNEPVARQAMERYSPYLTDEDRKTLDPFISTMQRARDGDAAAQQTQAGRQRQLTSDVLAHEYSAKLLNPQSGEVQAPQNWLRDMAADPRMDAPTKAVLWQTFARLQQGDAPQSDGALVSSLLDRMSGPDRPELAEVLNHAGRGLRAADALLLAAGSPMASTGNALQPLANTVAEVRDRVMKPDFGAAGAAAFDRFVNWILPAYRQTGLPGLDPMHETYLLPDGVRPFMPSGDDLRTGVRYPTERPSLGEIFGGARGRR